MATHRRKIARSAVRRVKRRNTKLRTLRSRKNTTEKKARMNMRKMRGGGGNYDIYLVYFDDVAKLKDPANWKQWPTLSTSKNSPLVGVLFYNPTDNKFYFFGYKNFLSNEGSESRGGIEEVKTTWYRRVNFVKSNYLFKIRLNLVESLLTTPSFNPEYNLNYWSHILGGVDSGVARGGRQLGQDNFDYYLTFSDGDLKYTTKKPPGIMSDGGYFSETFFERDKDIKLSNLPSTTMLSSLTQAEPVTTTTNNPDGSAFKCTLTKRAYLFYKLPEKYKEEYDPTPGRMKTDSKPLETADKLIEEIKRAQSADSSNQLLPPPAEESTPVLNFNWVCQY
jgi:hypothetical protein